MTEAFPLRGSIHARGVTSRAGKSVAVATVVSVKGSAPRAVGSKWLSLPMAEWRGASVGVAWRTT